MHFIGDELRMMGHGVDFAFEDDLHVGSHGPARRLLAPIQVVATVRQRLREGRSYDAVEIHEPLAAAYALARSADRSLPPLILVSYGLEGRRHAAMMAYYRKKRIKVSGRRRYAPYATVAQSEIALRLADHVTVETSDDEAYVADVVGRSKNRLTIVNGGLTQTFLSAPAPIQTGEGVLFLGSWIDRKGTQDIVPALTTVLEARPNATFTIAGCGDMDAVRLFPAQLHHRIHQIPRVTGEAELLAVYRKHAVFVAPSIFEGQLLTMLEAAGAGLPVVATRRCGMKDFVRDGETGFLVEAGEPAELAFAIIRLLDDPAERMRIASAAQATARTFTWGRSARQFLDAAERAVARQPV